MPLGCKQGRSLAKRIDWRRTPRYRGGDNRRTSLPSQGQTGGPYIHVGGLQYTTYDWTLKIGGISNGYQGSEFGLHLGDPELGTREIGMAGRIRRGDIIHEVRRM